MTREREQSWSENEDLRLQKSGRAPNVNQNFGESSVPANPLGQLPYATRPVPTPVDTVDSGLSASEPEPVGANQFGALSFKTKPVPVAEPVSGRLPVAPVAPVTSKVRSGGLPKGLPSVAGALPPALPQALPQAGRGLPVVEKPGPNPVPEYALPVAPVKTVPTLDSVVITPPVEPTLSEATDSPSDKVKKRKAPAGAGRPKSGEAPKNVQESLILVDQGFDEDNPGFEDSGTKSSDVDYSFSSRNIRITARDIDMITFLARFRYANGLQLARYVGSSRKSVDQRLTKLGKAGLIRREDIVAGNGVWTATAMGLATANMDFAAIGSGKISPVTTAHTLGLVNLAISLEKAYENILGSDDFGELNRVDSKGDLVPGEVLVSEREIRQSESRWKSHMVRTDMERAHMRAMEEWRRGDTSLPSPELEVGDEAMFILWATRAGRSDHIPDMVVAKPREYDGSPGSIAIELELSTKPMKEWRRILSTFAEDNVLYKHVHYFTDKKNIMRGLETVAREVGLLEQGRFTVHSYKPAGGGKPFWG